MDHRSKVAMQQAVHRIIDANFNRAREAARSVEEFCRFALNSDSLTRRAKQLRHELSACIGKLDAARLISSRDTLGDVGVGQKVDNQLSRGDLYDCCTAACKRLTEALRVLAEALRIEKQPQADTIEGLRYAAYTLEKDIVLQSNTIEKFRNVRLYVVITSDLPDEVIPLARKCATGGADCIQLRAKTGLAGFDGAVPSKAACPSAARERDSQLSKRRKADSPRAKTIEDDALFALAADFVKGCRDAGIVSIINDRTDVAVAAGADGVHLGQNDLPVAQARKLALAPLIVGKSTHSLEQLRAARQEQPTYVGLGPVFATPTKPDAPVVGLDYVSQAAQALANEAIGHVAIGGITADNVDQVLDAGARAIAVCSAVTHAADPTAACRELKEKISAHQGL
ncbi:MAG: thiamine phosphate synthase [Sedimentisphaerales bacterium]